MNFIQNINATTLIISILSITVIILIVLVVRLNMRLSRFLIGTEVKDLAESLAYLRKHSQDTDTFRTELEKYLETVEKRLRRSVQSMHTVRFNPFKGTGSGGNQSFATAFLTEDGDGVVLSSLYSREHVSVFSKPIKTNKSEFDLSAEESDALATAKSKLS
jgi:hypothetical protein